MRYECHVTVEDFPSSLQVNQFAQTCQKMMGKANLIELNRGEHPLQLMLAKKAEFNTDAEAIEWGNTLAKMLEIEGWSIRRVKVESQLKDGDEAEYYEAHYKLEITDEGHRQALDNFCQFYPFFLRSKSLFGRRTHYLSLRYYPPIMDKNSTWTWQRMVAHDEFNKGLFFITTANLPLDKNHYERVLFDSNPELDAGWPTT